MNIVKEVAKQSFRDLLSKNSEVRVKDLEAEVINLIWYLSLRKLNEIHWTLPFLNENMISEIIAQDLDIMEGVTQKYPPDRPIYLYPNFFQTFGSWKTTTLSQFPHALPGRLPARCSP